MLTKHPMTWIMWLQDPVMREFAIQAGGGSFFANFTGNPAAQINQGFYNNQADAPAGRPRPVEETTGRGSAAEREAGIPDAGVRQRLSCRTPVLPLLRYDPISLETGSRTRWPCSRGGFLSVCCGATPRPGRQPLEGLLFNRMAGSGCRPSGQAGRRKWAFQRVPAARVRNSGKAGAREWSSFFLVLISMCG